VADTSACRSLQTSTTIKEGSQQEKRTNTSIPRLPPSITISSGHIWPTIQDSEDGGTDQRKKKKKDRAIVNRGIPLDTSDALRGKRTDERITIAIKTQKEQMVLDREHIL